MTIILIDTKAIAELLGVSRRHTTNTIIKRPDFPKPAIDLSQRCRRWRDVDVLRWAKLLK